MKKLFLIYLLSLISIVNAATLQEMYDQAAAGEGYQKLVILEKDSVYIGGLIQDVQSLCIHGNGAIIDLNGSSITVDGKDYILDIDHCVIKSSSDTSQVYLQYRNYAYGRIINNTFWGLFNDKKASGAIYLERCLKDTILIANNIFSNFNESLYVYFFDSDSSYENFYFDIEYNLHWNCETPYMVWGGWTGFPAPFIPRPGNGELLNDPQLTAPQEGDFSLSSASVCIDNGMELWHDFQGNAPDIGALESSYSAFRGTKLSGEITANITKENSPYIIEDDLIIPAGEKISIEPGVEMKVDYLKSLIVYGELQINGSADDSIKITNHSCYNNHWGQILFSGEASEYSTIKYTNIEYGSYSERGSGTICCLNDSISIFNCCFKRDNSTIYCGEKSKVRISNNKFYNESTFTGERVITCAPSSTPLIDNNILYSCSIYADSANPKIIKNKFMGQKSKPGQQYWIITLTNKSESRIESNLLKDNYGAILVEGSSTLYSVNNLITGCDNAMHISDHSDGSITNNTIYSHGYGITGDVNAIINISNSIIWTVGENSKAIRVFNSAQIEAKYCDLSTEFEGDEIIYDDPLFLNPDEGDFHLLANSPCIDSGDPDTSGIYFSTTDFDGKARVVNGRIDMGCYEFQHLDNIEAQKNISLSTFVLNQNYPNPFNPVTVISYTIPQNTHVVLDIYDLRGRRLRNLVNTYQLAGSYTVRFDAGDLSAGIYYYKLKTSNALEQVRKMVYLK